MATAYTTRYGNENTGLGLAEMPSPSAFLVFDGGSIDCLSAESVATTGSGREANASSPDEVSRVICLAG